MNIGKIPVAKVNPPDVVEIRNDGATLDFAYDVKKTITYTDWPHWVDGLPVSRPLMEFAQQLRRKLPTVKFGVVELPRSRQRAFVQTITTGSSIPVVCELVVYRPNDEYALGTICYADLMDSSTSRWVYGVGSRKVNNGKMREDNWRRQYLMTTNIDKAVSNACKNLIRFSLTEIADESYRNFKYRLTEAADAVVGEAERFVSSCCNSRVIDTELRNLIRLGVEFVTPEFKAAAAQFLAADAQAAAVKAQRVGAYFIQLREDRVHEGMVADVLTYGMDVKRNRAQTPSETALLKDCDLPEDVQRSIAMLSMMSAETYVPGVGMKVSERTFWLERPY
jgi:hypothetical protein